MTSDLALHRKTPLARGCAGIGQPQLWVDRPRFLTHPIAHCLLQRDDHCFELSPLTNSPTMVRKGRTTESRHATRMLRPNQFPWYVIRKGSWLSGSHSWSRRLQVPPPPPHIQQVNNSAHPAPILFTTSAVSSPEKQSSNLLHRRGCAGTPLILDKAQPLEIIAELMRFAGMSVGPCSPVLRHVVVLRSYNCFPCCRDMQAISRDRSIILAFRIGVVMRKIRSRQTILSVGFCVCCWD